jgi:hypothetical protein
MPELSIQIFGPSLSLDPSAGDLVAIVEAEGGTDSYLLDPERGRIRLEPIPSSRDGDKWLSTGGLILAARLKLWGLSLRLDGVPDPSRPERPGKARKRRGKAPVSFWDLSEDRDPSRSSKVDLESVQRAYVPRDVCSCIRCRDLIIARRDRRSGNAILSGLSQRFYRRIRWYLERRVGKLPECVGRSDPRYNHGVDCPSFDLWLKPFAAREAEARALELATGPDPSPLFEPEREPRPKPIRVKRKGGRS